MAVTQYIGARYVPVFADPAEWSSSKQYEPLTIVLHDGNSYTSRQFVPVGVNITNADFWAETGNYNAQVEAYREETARAFAAANSFFDTVAAMKASQDLYVGMVCHTLGFYTIGDGGASTYVISDDGIANEMNVIACSNNMFATLVVSQEINIEQLGEVTSASVSYAFANYKKVKFVSTHSIDFTITVPDYKILEFNSITYNGNGVAISVNSYATVNGYGLYSHGVGVEFKTINSTIEKTSVTIRDLQSDSSCISLNAISGGIIDCKINGGLYKCNSGSVIDVSGLSGYVGQINFNISRLSAINDYAIRLDSSSGVNLKGFDFGYASFEGSKNGLYFNFTNNSEPIFGYFRMAEMDSTNAVFFKFVGVTGKLYEVSRLSFDRCPLRGVDCSEVRMGGQVNTYPWGYIILNGRLAGDSGSFCHEGFVYTNRLTLIAPNTISYIDRDYNWEIGARIIQTLVTTGSAPLAITIPSWLGYYSKSFRIVVQTVNQQVTVNRPDGTLLVDLSTLNLSANDMVCFEVEQSTGKEQLIWYVYNKSTYPKAY